MKILLLQLPVQGHDFFFSNENIPLAPGYLKAVAEEEGFHAELVPVHLMRYGSDQALLQFVLDARPDLVGMSCYLWNVERSLFLARQIKRHLPTCWIVMGGPEVTPENGFLLEHRDFDVGVVGEGEEPWHDLLRSFPKVSHLPGILLPHEGGRWHFTGPNGSSSSLGRWPSPFLSGCLDSHLDRVLWIESVRGCAHRCAYCYYHKQSPHVRSFPLERV